MKIVILGGGISGLSAAYFLRKKHPTARIVLLEKERRLGGWIETKQCGEFSFELGPRTFQRSRCPELLQLISQLQIESELRVSEPATRYLWSRGKLRSIGSHWGTLFKAIARDLLQSRHQGGEETIHEFAVRRFGKRAAELFFDPMAKGIFGGDCRELSLDACFPTLREWERKHRSLFLASFKQKRGARGLFTLRGGMGRLIEELAKFPDEIHLGCDAREMPEADLVISALPAEEIARLIGIDTPVPCTHFSVVNLGFGSQISCPPGYGYLVPSSEQERILGQIWDSSIFPSPGLALMTSMVRGPDPQAVALDALQRHLGIKTRPDAIHAKEVSIPQYRLGHAERITKFEQEAARRFPRLRIIGNFLTGPSVESCIERARQN